MKKISIVLVVLFFSSILFAQGSNCKVINKELKGVYSGDCKSGLAHGSGVFTFEKGMFVYKGEFENGKMHGKGEMYSLINNEKKLVSKGSWVENVFVVEKSSKPFDIIRSKSVNRSTVRKLKDGNSLAIDFYRNGIRNEVKDLSVSLSTGDLVYGSNILKYTNVIFPLRCVITYRSKNKTEHYWFEVRYEVIINESGEWSLSLYN